MQNIQHPNNLNLCVSFLLEQARVAEVTQDHKVFQQLLTRIHILWKELNVATHHQSSALLGTQEQNVHAIFSYLNYIKKKLNEPSNSTTLSPALIDEITFVAQQAVFMSTPQTAENSGAKKSLTQAECLKINAYARDELPQNPLLAISKISEVLQIDPTNPYARNTYARCLLNIFESARAIEEASIILSKDSVPTWEKKYALQTRAHSHLALKNTSAALDDINLVMTDALEIQANLYSSQMVNDMRMQRSLVDYDNKIAKVFSEVQSPSLSQEPSSPVSSPDASLFSAVNTLKSDPVNVQAYLILCAAYLDKNMYEAAQICVDKVLQLDPINLDAKILKAMILLRSLEWSKAFEILNEVIAIEPLLPQTQLLFSMMLQDFSSSLETMNTTQASSIHIQDESLNFSKAQAYFQWHQYFDALISVQKVLLKDPTHLMAQLLLEEIKAVCERTSNPVKEIPLSPAHNLPLDARTKHFNFQLLNTKAKLEARDFSSAFKSVIDALSLDPFNRIGRLLYQETMCRIQAQDTFNFVHVESLEFPSDYPLINAELFRIRYLIDWNQDFNALERVKSLLAIDPHNQQALVLKKEIDESIDRNWNPYLATPGPIVSSIASSSTTTTTSTNDTLDPEYQMHLLKLKIKHFISTKQYNDALKTAQEALQLDPNDPEVLMLLTEMSPN